MDEEQRPGEDQLTNEDVLVAALRLVFDEVGVACAAVVVDTGGASGAAAGARECLRRIAKIRERTLTPRRERDQRAGEAVEAGPSGVVPEVSAPTPGDGRASVVGCVDGRLVHTLPQAQHAIRPGETREDAAIHAAPKLGVTPNACVHGAWNADGSCCTCGAKGTAPWYRHATAAGDIGAPPDFCCISVARGGRCRCEPAADSSRPATADPGDARRALEAILVHASDQCECSLVTECLREVARLSAAPITRNAGEP